MYLEWVKTFYDSIKIIIEVGKLFRVPDKYKEQLTNPEIFKNLRDLHVEGNLILACGDNNQLFVGDLEKIPKKEKKILVNCFLTDEHKDIKEIDFIEETFYPRTKKFNENKFVDEEVSKILKYVDLRIRNVLELSFYIRGLYKGNNKQEAERVKDDLGLHYGKDGRRLCNLYLTKYIEALANYTLDLFWEDDEKIQSEINHRIMELISKPIFYIHPKHDASLIVLEIKKSIHSREPFIAIHATGRNIKKAIKIVSKINKIAKIDYDLKEEEKKIAGTKFYIYRLTLKKRKPF